MDRATFVYDGDCAFCTRCADFIGRWIRTSARVVPWQSADLTALGLTPAECDESVWWIGPDGVRLAGPDAIARLLVDGGRFWRLPGRLLRLSPVRALAWPVYRWVGRNRHRMPGGTASCSLPQAERPGPATGRAGPETGPTRPETGPAGTSR